MITAFNLDVIEFQVAHWREYYFLNAVLEQMFHHFTVIILVFFKSLWAGHLYTRHIIKHN